MLRIAATLLCFLTTAASLDIDTWDGGYKDIWVSISESVPYNESIIENIKALFRSSSAFLHKATNGRVYFKHVTIEVPKTWPKRSSARALSSGFFDRSDVRVDQPTALHGDRPFTVQKRRCGEPGDFIQVTPAFLAAIGNSTADKLENAAYVMVHEWAHYRYGVFDEHGNADDKRYPLTYCDRGKVKLNACSSRMAFTARRADGGKCEINDKCRFAKDCVVTLQQPSWNPVESSIMFMPYLANVSQFCDDRDGPNAHNPFAPSKQNDLCKQQSTWKVISGNADFQK
ncbi:calcium-activated chloride channel regulator 1-like [Dermacentor andersoni]|uniref:calcium-activated chloride channel regulator 1-like n=1 Tax=Dermacentor andersoni TaxID=34620 RepID=UPI003B3B1FC6